MNVSKIQLILRKLNNLVEGIENGGDSVSAIERDLYRSYLTQLFDLSLSSDQSGEEDDDPVIIFSEEDYTRETSKEQASPTPVQAETPTSDTHVKKPDSREETMTISNEPSELMSENTDNETDARDSIKSLFKLKQTVDISDQLNQRPVNDISKAMSINDRMLTINQLFGGNETIFHSTLERLNSMNNYDEAKQFLMKDVAMNNDWDKGERPEAAELFINLVHRKFSDK